MTKLNQKTVRKVPRGDRRRMELARVAERTFLKHGFSDTTMQMIASEAGSSKETLYRHFCSKEALFAELVSARAATTSGPKSALASDAPAEPALTELGMNLMQLLVAEDSALLLRMVIAEAHRAPDLGHLLYKHGPAATLERLAKYLQAATLRGELRCPDPKLAARLFLGAVASHYHLHCLIGQPAKRLTPAEMRKHVAAAVEMFLARFA